MISLASGTKVFLPCSPIDLRAGFNGLAANVQQMIGQDSFGAVCTFSAANAAATLNGGVALLATCRKGIRHVATVWCGWSSVHAIRFSPQVCAHAERMVQITKADTSLADRRSLDCVRSGGSRMVDVW
ncbi:hypothetical protein [Acidisphaera sp. S103]|uniref:hypothetical protein n=1 Tax=Acidisphaera sp. S103 TaxID=1747223 RepID=UPI00131DC9EF|nr:hypothetical protein [Acidisphaera sp. S103]